MNKQGYMKRICANATKSQFTTKAITQVYQDQIGVMIVMKKQYNVELSCAALYAASSSSVLLDMAATD